MPAFFSFHNRMIESVIELRSEPKSGYIEVSEDYMVCEWVTVRLPYRFFSNKITFAGKNRKDAPSEGRKRG